MLISNGQMMGPPSWITSQELPSPVRRDRPLIEILACIDEMCKPQPSADYRLRIYSHMPQTAWTSVSHRPEYWCRFNKVSTLL